MRPAIVGRETPSFFRRAQRARRARKSRDSVNKDTEVRRHPVTGLSAASRAVVLENSATVEAGTCARSALASSRRNRDWRRRTGKSYVSLDRENGDEAVRPEIE
jgi:hypothetical protein